MQSAVADACRLTAAAERITVLTGAGISTDSGIPDFRGPRGSWTRNPEAEKRSNLRYYLEDESVRRAAWQDRLSSPAWTAKPNAGHAALVDLERKRRLGALLTQNTDELHQAAGSDPDLVIELHGTMREVICWTCGLRAPMQTALDRVRAGEVDPPCEVCGGILKSATVSFGQALDPQVLAAAARASQLCDVFIAIGTTLKVQPAAGCASVAKDAGAALIIVNAGATAYDALADVVVRGSISEVLPRLVAAGVTSSPGESSRLV